MSIHDIHDGAQLIAASMDILTRHKISITVGENFEEYREILAEARPDQPLSPPFDPDLQYMTPSNSFWIVGHDPHGKVVHTQAMRMFDLQDDTLANHLRTGFKEYPPAALDIDFERSRYRAGPGARRIHGRVCYHGEVWLDGSTGQFRGSGVSSVLGRFAFMTAMLRWSPDWVFGFMPKSVAWKGFAERQGYMHAEPGVLRWYRNDSDLPLEGFMVYMARDDIRYLMSMPLHDRPLETQSPDLVTGALHLLLGRVGQPMAAAFTSSSIYGRYCAKLSANIFTSFSACTS
jgi:hypothetical protein